MDKLKEKGYEKFADREKLLINQYRMKSDTSFWKSQSNHYLFAPFLSHSTVLLLIVF